MKLKRLFCLLVLLCLTVGALALNASAAEIVASGTCGDNLTWTLDDDGTLTISGIGKMELGDWGETPWQSYSSLIKKAIIKEGVTSIGNNAFTRVESLTSVEIPNSVTTIGYCAFGDCKGLTSVSISHNVTYIDEYAFAGCHSLTSVTIPGSISFLPDAAFGSCVNLSTVVIEEGVKEIGQFTFDGCHKLVSVTMPDSVKVIGYGAFANCTSLHKLIIPKGVESIGPWAFAEDSNLKQLIFQGDAPELGEGCFEGINSVIYYPPDNETWPATVTFDHCRMTGYVVQVQQVAPEILTQPKTVYVKSGATAKVSVQAEGKGLQYTWYIRNANATRYSKSSVTTNTYGTKMTDSTKDCYVYCVITDAYGNSVKSNTVLLRMVATITQQPENVAVNAGETAKVTLKAAGDGLTYKWYYKNPGQSKFTLTTSFKGESYSVSMNEARNGRQVYCVVTDKYGKTAKSDVVTLSMKQELKITAQPKTVYVKSGATAKVTVEAQGDGLKYTWYIRNANATRYSKSSVTTNTYGTKMTDSTKGRYVYCVITDAYGNSVKSNTVLLRMAATITAQPKSVTVANGTTAKVTVGAAGDGLTYKWYYKNPGQSKFTLTTAFKGNSYSIAMNEARDGRQVYCVITDKYGKSVKSDVVILKMK